MKRDAKLVLLAAKAALRSKGQKHFLVGAAAIRSDGTIVYSGNGPTPGRDRHAHAETRLAQKLDHGATVFVVRLKRNGRLGLARPCDSCQKALWAKGAEVWFSDEEGEFERLW